MASVMEFHTRHEIGALARVIEEESDRLCAIIDTARSFDVREQAFRELRELADTVRLLIAGFERDSEEPEWTEAVAFKAAA